MNKRALVGKLLLVAIVVIIVMGVTVYFSFRQTGFSLKTGDVKFSVDYEPEKEKPNNDGGAQIVEVDEGNTIPAAPEINPNSTLNITDDNNTLNFENISE